MKKQSLKKKLIPTLLATVYTIPALGCADEPVNKGQAPKQEAVKPTIASEAVQQEVIQLLRQGETDGVTLNIAGRPGTYFRVLYSPTGQDNSYAPVPKGEGVIGQNGMGSVAFALKALAKEEVYLKVTTSDTADFQKTRVTPKPMILEVEPVQVKQRGIGDSIKELQEKEVRTPSAVAGVRG
ncbi:MAG: hypothetical protein HY911_12220 [Desulfobacterales bacterium]|nr:hypothetical protein [Desulfobacterales bacterium]